MGVDKGDFLAKKFEGLEIWAQKFEVPTPILLGRSTPQGGLPGGPQRARGPGQTTGHAGQPSRAKGSGGPAYLHE